MDRQKQTQLLEVEEESSGVKRLEVISEAIMVSPDLIRLLYLIIIYSNSALVFYVSNTPEQDQLVIKFKENLREFCAVNASALSRDELLNASNVLRKVAMIDFDTDSLVPSRVIQDLRDDLDKHWKTRVTVYKIMTESAGWSCNGGFRNLSQVQDSYKGTSESVDWLQICQIPRISLYRQYLNFKASPDQIRLDDKYPANCSELGFNVQDIDGFGPDHGKTRIMIEDWRVIQTGSWCRMKCFNGTKQERRLTNSSVVDSCPSCAQCRSDVFDSETCYTPAYKVPAETPHYDTVPDYWYAYLGVYLSILFFICGITFIRHGFSFNKRVHLKLQFIINIIFILFQVWQARVGLNSSWLILNIVLLQLLIAACMVNDPYEDRVRLVRKVPWIEDLYIWLVYLVPCILSIYLVATIHNHEKYSLNLYESWIRSTGYLICVIQLVCCLLWHLYVYYRHRDQCKWWWMLIRMIISTVLSYGIIHQWTSYTVHDHMINAISQFYGLVILFLQHLFSFCISRIIK